MSLSASDLREMFRIQLFFAPHFRSTRRGELMKNLLMWALAVVLIGAPVLVTATSAQANDKQKDEERLQNSGIVLQEILDVPEDIPHQLLDKADCIVVFPSVLKAAFLVGGQYGRGAMVCRTGAQFDGSWGAPTMMALEGGSFGLQLGGQATDFVLLVMNDAGAKSILNDKVKLGADASVAAGPKGRDLEADTTINLRAEILSYSRTKGAFAGISLEGSTIRPDKDANERLYGKKLSAREIALAGTVKPPASASAFLATLTRYTPKHVG